MDTAPLAVTQGDPPPVGTDPTEAVADRAGRALGWSLLNTVVARFGTVAIGIVIARLLGDRMQAAA